MDAFEQVGASAEPSHSATQLPMLLPVSTYQQNDPTSQVSKPDVAPPMTSHDSPGCSGEAATGKQPSAFQAAVPSSAYGLHFCPSGQSCRYESQAEVLPVSVSVGSKDPLSALVLSADDESRAPLEDMLSETGVDSVAAEGPVDGVPVDVEVPPSVPSIEVVGPHPRAVQAASTSE